SLRLVMLLLRLVMLLAAVLPLALSLFR
ncbi:hypothetical protein A2U01_0049733, partial [Trifolium medium]|nr:hypothetical protein [Trifolium medium]